MSIPLSADSGGGIPPLVPRSLGAMSSPDMAPSSVPISSPLVSGGDSEAVSGSTAPLVGAPNAATLPTNGTSKKRKKGPTTTNTLTPLDAANFSARQKLVNDRIQALQVVLDAAESSPPTMVANQSTAETKTKALYSAARDVWGFIRGWHSRDIIPPGDVSCIIKEDAEWQASLDYATLCHPTGDCVRCVPCLALFGVTKTWANNSGGVTGTLRDHLVDAHPVLYYAKCHEKGLKERLTNSDSDMVDIPPEFTDSGFVDHMLQWIISDDQPMNVVEKEEFRELLIYCGQGRIRDQDIPHRDKLTAAAWAMYLLEKEKIDDEMKSAQGAISLMSDLWTDTNRRSFMAITAHYINNSGSLVDQLIAFHKINGHHTGANVGHALFEVLQESGITNKIGYITLDNASNNNTLMEELANSLQAYGAEFDPEKNHIWCFPHVINLAVQMIIKELANAAVMFRADGPGLPISEDGEHYLRALESNPIEVCRSSVSACRSSGLRREGLREVIKAGNHAAHFRLPGGAPYVVPLLQLLCDMPVRWSSTYNMLRCYLELYPAIVKYAFRVHREIHIPILSHKQYEVLQDIVSILKVAHNAQELLSAEKTPTLALAFPVYETIIDAWEQYSVAILELSHAIECSIRKVTEYINRTQDAPVHALVMAINPTLKLDWTRAVEELTLVDSRTRAHRMPNKAHEAELTVKREMLHIHQALGGSLRGYQLLTQASGATVCRASERGRLQTQGTFDLMEDTHESQSNNPGTQAALELQSAPSTPSNPFASIEEEFVHYMSAGTTTWTAESEQIGSVKLVEYWKVHQYTYPLLYHIAMNILPAQASSVSSERVFSSSKKTCTSKCSRLSAESMEYLQVLKHLLVRRRRTRGAAISQDDWVFDFV
ncbi:unnamed protein product, partial [Rhizoctonia solani]